MEIVVYQIKQGKQSECLSKLKLYMNLLFK